MQLQFEVNFPADDLAIFAYHLTQLKLLVFFFSPVNFDFHVTENQN